MARSNSVSQQAMSPGPAVTNMSTDVPALDQAQLGKRGNFIAGLKNVADFVLEERRSELAGVRPRLRGSTNERLFGRQWCTGLGSTGLS